MRDASPRTIRLQDYRPPAFLIDQTRLEIALGEDTTQVTARLSVRRNPDANAEKSKDLILDSGNLSLDKILLNDQPVEETQYQLAPESLTVKAVPDQFELLTVTHIKPQENTTLEGLYKSSGKFCTQCEAEGFRNITFYLDRPDVMSEFHTRILADKRQYPVLLSNGNPVDSGEESGRHWVEWHDPFKKPCYLFAMVAGNLSVVDDQFTTVSGRPVKLQIFVEEKDLDKCDHAMTSLKNAMRWDEEVYGREYDLDIFMIVAVDDFNMGAMENKGLNIFNTSCVLANPDITTDAAFQRVEAVVAHEYFHNWSGNRVTCRDWFQLSLKEGFTVFRDSQFSADMGSPAVKRVEDVTLLRTLQFAEDAGPTAHPVQPASYMEISNFYTLTIYEKGAEIVRMIYNLLGPDLFRKGSDLYFERHDGQAVTINEFASAMEAVSGRDLTQFKRWYTQAGTPRLNMTGEYNAGAQEYVLTVEQSCPPTPEGDEKQPLHIPLAMALIGEQGELPLVTDSGESNGVLELTAEKEQFVFKNIAEAPVPSLLRNFSAPVKMQFDYSREDLLRLIRLDSDGFSRWDACQSLATRIIHEAMSSLETGSSPGTGSSLETGSSPETGLAIDAGFADSLGSLLDNILEGNSLDPAMVALMLRLPSEAYLGEIADTIDPDAIHHARHRVSLALASRLEKQLVAVYDTLHSDAPYAPTAEQIARRSLKNTALAYLSLLGTDASLQRCVNQYRSEHNMTDRLAALSAVINSEAPCAQQQAAQCLDDFYQRFQHEPLAVDIWLSVQAACRHPDTLQRVTQLLEHPSFSIKNPNKVRALIGAFCGQNLVNFHSADGAGYQFLGRQIQTLDTINPQIAARLLTPLTRWRKYDKSRQGLMCAELEAIQKMPGLSKDVFEIVSKSLG